MFKTRLQAELVTIYTMLVWFTSVVNDPRQVDNLATHVQYYKLYYSHDLWESCDQGKQESRTREAL